jgi:hypothetical protein
MCGGRGRATQTARPRSDHSAGAERKGWGRDKETKIRLGCCIRLLRCCIAALLPEECAS